jgi:hypothetical protein
MGQKQPFEPDLPNVRFAPKADVRTLVQFDLGLWTISGQDCA